MIGLKQKPGYELARIYDVGEYLDRSPRGGGGCRTIRQSRLQRLRRLGPSLYGDVAQLLERLPCTQEAVG